MYIGLTINSNLKYFDRIMTVAIYVPHHSIDLAVSVCVLQHHDLMRGGFLSYAWVYDKEKRLFTNAKNITKKTPMLYRYTFK